MPPAEGHSRRHRQKEGGTAVRGPGEEAGERHQPISAMDRWTAQ